MGEKPKRIPTSKDQRKPLLDAARAGKPDLIDKALAGFLAGHIEDIRILLSREWDTLLTDANRSLLLNRLDAMQQILTSTRNAVAQTSEVIASQQATQPAPAARPSAPDYAPAPTPSAPAASGPSRGTRTTPVAPPAFTHVAEGMSR